MFTPHIQTEPAGRSHSDDALGNGGAGGYRRSLQHTDGRRERNDGLRIEWQTDRKDRQFAKTAHSLQRRNRLLA